MTYLLDTHCLIWFQENNPRIPQKVLQEIVNPENIIYFNQVSLFEIAIKKSIGKLPHFSTSVKEIYDQALKDQFTFLPTQNKHIDAYANVPLLDEHRDPFDRLLIATALVEQLPIITIDRNFKLYSDIVTVFW